MADIKAVDKSDSISMAVMAKSGVSVNMSNSMASLNNESMAGVDDTTFKVRQDQADVMGAENPEGNMLDGLKQELNIPTVGNPQGNDENDDNIIRQATIDIMEKYKTSQVLDEQDDDAYVSESSEDRDEESKSGKRRIRVSFNTAGLEKKRTSEKPKRLTDLVRSSSTPRSRRYQPDETIGEEQSSAETPTPESRSLRTSQF